MLMWFISLDSYVHYKKMVLKTKLTFVGQEIQSLVPCEGETPYRHLIREQVYATDRYYLYQQPVDPK